MNNHESTRLQKAILSLGWIAIVIGIGLILLAIYWMVYPYNVLELKEGHGDLITHEVKSGGYLQMRHHYCKNRPLSATITREFVDGIVYRSPAFHSDKEVGCKDTIEYIYIPRALPQVGEYMLETIITYKVNPIRDVTYKITTDVFIIKE